MKRTLKERLEAMTEKGNKCWLFIGCKNSWGYGFIRVDGLNKYAHRVAYELSKGPIKDGQVVMHSCDNPGCVNPDHLSVGTHQDNMDDAVAKQRTARGDCVNTSRLKKAAVIEIRRRAEIGESFRCLGRLFGVSHQTISSVVKRKTWRHI